MAVAFLNPPPPGAEGDDTSDPIYQYGTPVGVKWTGVAASLTLWQLQPGSVKTFNTSEYLIDNTNTENSSDIHTYNDFNWLVLTSKNLTLSNRFILSLFEDSNQTTLLANSHYFQIRGDKNSTALITSSSIPSPTSSSTGSGTGIVTATVTTTPLIVTNPPTVDIRPLGLSVGAKVALGVGIPVAVLLGILVGWFCVRRGRKSLGSRNGKEQTGDRDDGDEKKEEGPREELAGCHGGKEMMGSLPPQYELGV